MTRNTSDALPFVRERLGAGQRLTAPDKLGWNRKTRTNRKPTELQPEVKENPERYQLREKKREREFTLQQQDLPSSWCVTSSGPSSGSRVAVRGNTRTIPRTPQHKTTKYIVHHCRPIGPTPLSISASSYVLEPTLQQFISKPIF